MFVSEILSISILPFQFSFSLIQTSLRWNLCSSEQILIIVDFRVLSQELNWSVLSDTSDLYSSKFLRELFSRCQFSQVVVRSFEISEIRLRKINIFSVENCYCLKQSTNLHLLYVSPFYNFFSVMRKYRVQSRLNCSSVSSFLILLLFVSFCIFFRKLNFVKSFIYL